MVLSLLVNWNNVILSLFSKIGNFESLFFNRLFEIGTSLKGFISTFIEYTKLIHRTFIFLLLLLTRNWQV